MWIMWATTCAFAQQDSPEETAALRLTSVPVIPARTEPLVLILLPAISVYAPMDTQGETAQTISMTVTQIHVKMAAHAWTGSLHSLVLVPMATLERFASLNSIRVNLDNVWKVTAPDFLPPRPCVYVMLVLLANFATLKSMNVARFSVRVVGSVWTYWPTLPASVPSATTDDIVSTNSTLTPALAAKFV